MQDRSAIVTRPEARISVWSRIESSSLRCPVICVYRWQNALYAHESKSRRTARAELVETRPRTVAAPRGVSRPPCVVQPVR